MSSLPFSFFFRSYCTIQMEPCAQVVDFETASQLSWNLCGLVRFYRYKPVLSSIENRLLQIRQDAPDVVFQTSVL